MEGISDDNKLNVQTTPSKRSLIFSAKLILLMSSVGVMYGIASERGDIGEPKEQTISSIEKDIKHGVRVRADTKRLETGKNKTTFEFQNNTKHSYSYTAAVTFQDPHGHRRTETLNSHCFDGDPPFLQSVDSRHLGHVNETVVDVEVTSLKGVPKTSSKAEVTNEDLPNPDRKKTRRKTKHRRNHACASKRGNRISNFHG